MAFGVILAASLAFLLCFQSVLATNFHTARNLRQPRSLIYPITAPTRLQFIGGIGIPVEDLSYESVTSGYVLKAEYFLPSKAEEMRPQYFKPMKVNRRSFEDNTNYNYTMTHAYNNASSDDERRTTFDTNLQRKQAMTWAYRWIIYKGMETLMTRAGLSGRECMLRSICEHAAVPFHYESGILSEILHIILTPSRSRDEFGHPSDRDYGHAERLGRNGADCAAAFITCEHSPIDQISNVLELDVEFKT